METIFDYELSEGELRRFGLFEVPPEILKTAKESKCEDSNLYQLGLLFSMRGDDKKAKTYWGKIKDKRILSTLIQDF